MLKLVLVGHSADILMQCLTQLAVGATEKPNKYFNWLSFWTIIRWGSFGAALEEQRFFLHLYLALVGASEHDTVSE